MCLSVCLSTLSWSHSHFLIDFRQKWHRYNVTTPKVRTSSLGVNVAPPYPLFCSKPPFWVTGPENPCKHIYANFCLKCSRIKHDGDVRFQTGSRNKPRSHTRIEKCNITVIYGRIAKILASYRKSGSRNTVMNINVCKFFGLLEEW